MARTQLYSAASGPARTAFHAHRGVRVEELQVELAQANEVVTTKIQGEIKEDGQRTRTRVRERFESLETTTLKNISDNVILIRDRDAIARPDLTPEKQSQFFGCMRILSQVENITIDESKNTDQKNRALGRIRNDTLLQGNVNELPEELRERVGVVQSDFPSALEDEAQEPLERFWIIQDLRRAIIADFAAQQPG